MGKGQKGPGPLNYRVIITPIALSMIQRIPDRRVREKIADVLERLAEDPEKQGKALLGELTGYRAVRAAGQRYRIIYRVEKERVIVIVVGVGVRKEGDRKDIYTLATKLFRQELL